MGFFSKEPKLDKDEKIDEEERAACLRYLKEEIKQMVFRDKEHNLYNLALSEHWQSTSSDSHGTKEMCRAANRLLQATEHIKKLFFMAECIHRLQCIYEGRLPILERKTYKL